MHFCLHISKKSSNFAVSKKVNSMKRYFLVAVLCLACVVAMAQPRHHHRPPCASQEQMQLVMKSLEKQSFDDQKLEIAELCVAIGSFCTRDLERMAKVFSFDDNRLAFLKFAYEYCTDPENYPMLKESFTFSSNYDKLIEYIHPEWKRH